MGFFEKIKAGLTRTKENIGHSFDQLFAGELNDDFYDELEETLILGDMGVETTMKAVEELRRRVKAEKIKDMEGARACLRQVLTDMLQVGEPDAEAGHRPVGGPVHRRQRRGQDHHHRQAGRPDEGGGPPGADGRRRHLPGRRRRPAGDLERAQRRGASSASTRGPTPRPWSLTPCPPPRPAAPTWCSCDTAGRLHNKQNLMNELNKISRVIDRELPDADRETLLVLDATTGQNGLIQAKQFKETAGITGIVLTKLDGTAKGGIVIAIAQELQVPVKFIGVGEGIDDLMPFEAENFVEALV